VNHPNKPLLKNNEDYEHVEGYLVMLEADNKEITKEFLKIINDTGKTVDASQLQKKPTGESLLPKRKPKRKAADDTSKAAKKTKVDQALKAGLRKCMIQHLCKLTQK
jgi:hypothetical protein